jgi:hypothetical protein
MEIAEIEALCAEGKLNLHTTSWHKGYISRKIKGVVKPYKGRHGTGYTIDKPTTLSSSYYIREYYILTN